MAEIVLTTLKVSVVGLIFAIGMASKPSDVTYLLQRPGLFFRSMLAMYVLVPLAALAIVLLLPMTPGTKAALLLLAASAGAPLLPKKLGKIGHESYVLSLVVLSSLLAIVVVPAWIAAYGQIFRVELELTFGQVAGILGKGFLLPVAAGMALRLLIPRYGDGISQWLLLASGIGLAVAALILVVSQLHLLKEVSLASFAALVFFLVVALAIGHILGGPDAKDRSALAVVCSTRHLGIVILVAASLPGARMAVLVVAYILASLLVTIPYMQWRQKVIGAAGGGGKGA